MIFQAESLSTILEEVKPLLLKHWAEIAHYKDIPLDPDYEMYLRLSQAGMLQVFTVRKEAKLIGYAAYVVRPNLHYKECITATEDVIFIDPQHRGRGKEFIEWCDHQLKLMGVKVVTHHIKFAFDWSKVLLKMGYEKTDMQLSKRLDR